MITMIMLVESLRSDDTISISTYAGRTAQILPATSGDEKEKIIYIGDNISALVRRIKTTLDAWELYGYKYFIGDGDGNILI